jgi:hypothetical protein
VSKPSDNQPVNFSVNPDQTPMFFVDTFLISSSEYALTINFAQVLPDGSQKQIVSRIAMTREQSKEFLATLNDHIEKYEI